MATTGNALKRNPLNRILLSPEKTQAVILASRGFGVRFIMSQTKMTPGAIKYWCGLAGVKISDFRNGKTQYARKFARETKSLAYNTLQHQHKQLKGTN